MAKTFEMDNQYSLEHKTRPFSETFTIYDQAGNAVHQRKIRAHPFVEYSFNTNSLEVSHFKPFLIDGNRAYIILNKFYENSNTPDQEILDFDPGKKDLQKIPKAVKFQGFSQITSSRFNPFHYKCNVIQTKVGEQTYIHVLNSQHPYPIFESTRTELEFDQKYQAYPFIKKRSNAAEVLESYDSFLILGRIGSMMNEREKLEKLAENDRSFTGLFTLENMAFKLFRMLD